MKILVADDASTMRVLLLSGLTRLGYQVEIVSSGDDAWTALHQPEAAEMAILDWMMPGMTGIDICRKLRERNDAPYVYTILLTGMDTADNLEAGLAAGADDYLTKPFKTAELDARLRTGRRFLQLRRELLAAQTEIDYLSNRDSLTSLWNRRMILARLDEELARALPENGSLGVILLDIDHLKRINHTWSDAEGDQVLQQVAARLTESIGADDSVGRFGGEEFLILARARNMYETVMLAERIRKAILDAPILSARGPITVSASFGVSAGLAEQYQASRALIVSAYQALDRAKTEGGNRVYLVASEMPADVLAKKADLATNERASIDGKENKLSTASSER